MKIKKYYAILQEKYKNSKGDLIIKEYVFNCEGIAPIFAKKDAEAFAKEKGYTVSMFCPCK